MSYSLRLSAAVLAVLAASGAGAQGPSFDCGKATTEIETAICASPDLSAADRGLSAAYRAALARAPEEAKPLLRGDQRAWLAHVGNICQARWAPKEHGADYAQGCLATAFEQQTKFYAAEALTPLPGDYGLLLARQAYRSVPVPAADQTDYLRRIRVEEHRFPQFLSPALKPLGRGEAPPPADDDALETLTRFEPRLTNGRLLTLDYLTYVYHGGAHGLYGSEFATFDLARGRELAAGDIFRPGSDWRALLALEADKSLRAIARQADWDYEPPAAADLLAAAGDSRRWVPGEAFGLYFGIYEVGPYAVGAPIAQVPYAVLRDVLTPAFKALVGVKD